MPADNVVGEDFKFRLIVHCSPIGQKHGFRKHFSIGLLRSGRDMYLALEDPGRFLVENIAECLAAHASRRRVLDLQSCIGMFAAAKQGYAT